MKTVRFLDPAESELLDAAVYYQRQSKGLGLRAIALKSADSKNALQVLSTQGGFQLFGHNSHFC